MVISSSEDMETSPSAGSRSGTISLTNGVDSMG